MKLTRLRLLGFKSFVEPTDFMIEPGLTGVVGPNGCGKSNLVEALRWVMGESSHKSMRASSMDDVIFSGSNSRPARNNAEVAIAIDNSTRSAPAAFNDQDSLRLPAASNAIPVQIIASTDERYARATSRSCSPTHRPAPARPPSSIRVASAKSFRPSLSSVVASLRKLPASLAYMPGAMRQSCA